MSLKEFIAALQKIAAETPDEGASLEVRSVYNFRGDLTDAHPVRKAKEVLPEYLNGENPCVIISYK